MVTIGQSRLILSTSFTVRDNEEVSITELPGIGNLTVRVVFDPSVPEGKTGPLIDWTGGEGKMRWTSKEKSSVIITCRGWTGQGSTSARGQIAMLDSELNSGELPTLDRPAGKSEVTFNLFDSRLKEFHHVIFELYRRPVTG
jgi:hypothetical protein